MFTLVEEAKSRLVIALENMDRFNITEPLVRANVQDALLFIEADIRKTKPKEPLIGSKGPVYIVDDM